MERKWNRLSKLMNISIFVQCKETLESSQEDCVSQPLYCSSALRQRLRKGAENQMIPYLYVDEYQVCFACIKEDDSFYMFGPMCIRMLDHMERHRFFSQYGVKEDQEKTLPRFFLTQILDTVNLATLMLSGKEYIDEELLYGNYLISDTKKKEKQEQILFDLRKEEEDLHHHTYLEERELLDCVREGRVQDALRHTRNLDMDLGKLSSQELNHWRNVMIVGITLCTRAAIEGGLTPAVAYRLSDFYIQKGDSCKNIAQMMEYRNQAIEDLAIRVARNQEKRSRYNYVERCKDYIEQNYRKKIYLDDLAESLKLNESYLSRLFRKETGTTMQEYIVKVRVEHTANLLIYSEESLATIAEYVGFPSQSYMGKMFKKYKGMSPRAFREKNKPTEF